MGLGGGGGVCVSHSSSYVCRRWRAAASIGIACAYRLALAAALDVIGDALSVDVSILGPIPPISWYVDLNVLLRSP